MRLRFAAFYQNMGRCKMSDGKFDDEGNRLRILNPQECEFEDTLNNLQICLTEIRRDIIRSEARLKKINPDESDEAYGKFLLESAFLKVCQSWEAKLSNDLEKKLKGQAVLPI